MTWNRCLAVSVVVVDVVGVLEVDSIFISSIGTSRDDVRFDGAVVDRVDGGGGPVGRLLQSVHETQLGG
ncbi:MAG: hypothetical protein AAF799_30190 [Myxococcota bacterium]